MSLQATNIPLHRPRASLHGPNICMTDRNFFEGLSVLWRTIQAISRKSCLATMTFSKSSRVVRIPSTGISGSAG